MPNTYVALDTQTLGSATASITLSSIPQGYTDLELIISGGMSAANNITIQFNGDTGSNYSRTVLYGTGSSAASFRESSISTSLNCAYMDTGQSITNIKLMNYSNTTTAKTFLVRSNPSTVGVYETVGLWRATSNAAITSIVLTAGGSNFIAGSTFSLYGIKSEEAASKATGGMVTSDSTYYYHTFTASGTFTPTQSLTCDYLVVAGGGAGGGGGNAANATGGGGGAGGYRTASAQTLTATNYSVTVGAGGTAVNAASGNNGSNSVFDTITSTGGGGGGKSDTNGKSGGSGGGSGNGATNVRTGGAGNTPSTSPSQGNSGAGSGSSTQSGTGGGSSGAGIQGSNPTAGGAGTSNSISGSAVTYAAGGGISNSTAGAANTGNGGGANTTNSAAAGGSGIVIIRYLKA